MEVKCFIKFRQIVMMQNSQVVEAYCLIYLISCSSANLKSFLIIAFSFLTSSTIMLDLTDVVVHSCLELLSYVIWGDFVNTTENLFIMFHGSFILTSNVERSAQAAVTPCLIWFGTNLTEKGQRFFKAFYWFLNFTEVITYLSPFVKEESSLCNFFSYHSFN